MSVPVSRGGRPGVRLKVLDRWACGRGVTLDLSQPSKPTDNAFAESLNGRFHDECLDTRWFLSVEDARSKIEAWRRGTTTRAGLAVPWGT